MISKNKLGDVYRILHNKHSCLNRQYREKFEHLVHYQKAKVHTLK